MHAQESENGNQKGMKMKNPGKIPDRESEILGEIGSTYLKDFRKELVRVLESLET